MRRIVLILMGGLLCGLSTVAAEELSWVKQEQAMLGPGAPVALVWSPEVKRFMSLGWVSSMYARRAPYTYDEVAFDSASGRWENWFPAGKNWGPQFGVCAPPGWKDRSRFADVEGNVRPNWPDYYWLLGASNNFTYLPDERSYLFYVDGQLFSYDPVRREWKDRAATGDPQRSTPLKSRLFWGSLCYDEARRQVVLFGGGNADTPRGDPGTWIYSPTENAWRECQLDVQPPPRANSRLAYDPANRLVVLFGGDALDRTLSDTWTFDGQRWTKKSPAIAPAPRAGHALMWLPQAKKLLLLGGYTVGSSVEYTSFPYSSLPLEAWTYDAQADVWSLHQRFETTKETAKTVPASPRYRVLKAAVAADDQIALVDDERQLWLGRLDATKPDAEGAAKYGVKPGTETRRTGAYDPAWYRENVPAAQPEQVAAELASLPVNRWVKRPTPKRPAPNLDWGSAVFAPELDQILRFSGGHSAYSGTAPHVYDVATDRYSLPFAPEFPIDWCFSNDQVPGEWSFSGSPWMTGHTYKSVGYDSRLKSMVFGPHNYTYYFEPSVGRWTRGTDLNPWRPDFYTVTMIPTSHGLVVWAFERQGGPGLWRLHPDDRTWGRLEVQGKLPGPRVDNSGVAYDSRRDRLVFIERAEPGCRMAAYDFNARRVDELTATGSDKIVGVERAQAIFREAVYLPREDALLIGATGYLLDCAKNAWFKAEIPSDDPPLTREGSYNIGVMYDPRRNLVWGVNTNSHVFVLKLDLPRAGAVELK